MAMTKIYSKIISGVLSPFLIPTYIYAVLIFYANSPVIPLTPILFIAGTVLIITAIIPYISTVWNKYNLKEDYKYNDIYYYLNTGVCYIIATYVLLKFGLPLWMVSFMVSNIILLIMIAILRKKYNVSRHMTAYGTYIGAVFVAAKLYNIIPLEFIAISILLGGMLGSSRAYLKGYSPFEIITGGVIGFALSYYTAILIK